MSSRYLRTAKAYMHISRRWSISLAYKEWTNNASSHYQSRRTSRVSSHLKTSSMEANYFNKLPRHQYQGFIQKQQQNQQQNQKQLEQWHID